MAAPEHTFGTRRIYYNNFAEHLQNTYNPNMVYPDLPNRWSDEDWRRLLEMVASFGFTHFEFWLVPRLFCRRGLAEDFGREFQRQMRVICDQAHRYHLQVALLAGLATVGDDWRTYCPNDPEEWREIRHLWDAWTRALPGIDMVSIFPGDPGACSRNGCTAETYIDRSIDIAHLVKRNLPTAEVEFGTWGPPFFGWGNIKGPEGWKGEFIPSYQMSAWDFDKRRAERSMQHLLKRLPDFPEPTCVAINLGFNGDGNPTPEQTAIPWANEIARTHRIHTWDFSLTEGENAIVPHYRFERLLEQRRKERAAAPYSGGICFTMTPMLNQLSLVEAAQSFLHPEGSPQAVAAGFYERLFGPRGRALAPYLPLFEIVPDWGNYVKLDMARGAYHRQMAELGDLLEDLAPGVRGDAALHPSPDTYRRELLFFARLFQDLSGVSPDYDQLRQRYWDRVYAIYDRLPEHVDPRPRAATDRLVDFFRTWTGGAGQRAGWWSALSGE